MSARTDYPPYGSTAVCRVCERTKRIHVSGMCWTCYAAPHVSLMRYWQDQGVPVVVRGVGNRLAFGDKV